jgi:hypothetical protein
MWTKTNTASVFFCKNEKCLKNTCVHCNLVWDTPPENGFTDEEMEAPLDELEETDMRRHMRCAEYAEEKALVDDAIRRGAGVKCPECGVVGRKDTACTHMKCTSCETEFCYVCGVADENLDKNLQDLKRGVEPSINRHNTNWRCNELRCPMFLTEIGEVDERWPTDEGVDSDDDTVVVENIDNDCVATFHHLRTVSLLREVVLRIGEARFVELQNFFPGVKNCGFSLHEILHLDTQLIKRGNEAPAKESG